MTGVFNEAKAKLKYCARFTLLHPHHLFSVTIQNLFTSSTRGQMPSGFAFYLLSRKEEWRRNSTPQLLEDVFLIYYSLAPIL